MGTVGTGEHTYRIIEDWAKLPEGTRFGILVGVVVDSKDRVYICQQRESPPILIFDRDGNYVDSKTPAGLIEGHIMYIDAGDNLYLVERIDHVAMKFDPNDNKLLEMGNRGHGSDTGVTALGGLVKRPGPPFNMPTRLMPCSTGELFVSDGYCNSRFHKFSESGALLDSWGEAGSDVGAFHLPHSLWISKDDLVYICDRNNNRVQIFDSHGRFVDQWTDMPGVTDICMDKEENVYVHENGYHGTDSKTKIMDKHGKVLSQFDSPQSHQIWVDRHGDIYQVVTWEQRVIKMIKQV